jgi:hypothetical protein
MVLTIDGIATRYSLFTLCRMMAVISQADDDQSITSS